MMLGKDSASQHFDAALFRHQPLGICAWRCTMTKCLTLVHQAALLHKITQEPILSNIQNSEKYKMSQHHISDNINSYINNVWNTVTTRWPARSLNFWPGCLQLSLRSATGRFEPVRSTRWETGSYRTNSGISELVWWYPRR